VLAQVVDCPALVQTAITTIGNLCANTGLNQACYGNISLKANPQPGIASFVFNKPGDVVRVVDLKTLRADPFDAITNQWGVALMRLQANIPDLLPGQMVNVLVFGDVQLENRVPSTPAPLVTVPANTVLLGAPQADGSVVGALSAGDQAFALNQSADGAWLRLELNSSDERIGWVPSSLLPPMSALPTFDPSAQSPMQAFSLQTGVSGVKCTGVPQDGLLVQTPGGGNIKVKLTVNDVDVELASTVFFQATPDNGLIISVIEGQATVELRGQTVVVPAGSWVSIPLDANYRPIGTISQPRGYIVDDMDKLPISLLQTSITVAPPFVESLSNLCVSNPNGAWLRAQPNSANQTILRVLTTDTAVIISGSTVNDGTQDWRQAETSDNQLTGWIEAASLSNCANPVSVTTTPAILANCIPRPDWTLIYTVLPGNTLAQIARVTRVSMAELALGNCLANLNTLVVGQRLRVPGQVFALTPFFPFQPPAITPQGNTQGNTKPQQPQQPKQPPTPTPLPTPTPPVIIN